MSSTYRDTLRLLKEEEGSFCPGTVLASRLGVSRTAIWKHIRKLASLGYEIESRPKEGYRLVRTPDLLIPEEVVPYLETSWIGKPYHYFPQIGSTNDEALRLAAQGSPHGCVVVAEEQTAGRGRLRRPWISPARHGIYLSLILRTSLPIRQAPQSTLVAALSLVRVLSARYRLGAVVKWPNDVLIGGRKVTGILTEMQSDQDMIRFLVIGIGINVNHTPDELTGPLRYPATSLAIESGNPIKRQDVLLAFLHRFEQDYEQFLRKGFSAVLPDLEEASGILGKTIKVHCGEKILRGKAVGFTHEGALRLLTEQNTEETLWVGDVTQIEGNF